MRLFHQWEVEDLISLVNQEIKPINEELNDAQITVAHENLRKNVHYYMNNYITFMPRDKPRSVYINLRLENDNVIDTLTG